MAELLSESELSDSLFVNRGADAPEEANHHPEILVHGWNRVRLALTNHPAGGLTAVDFGWRANSADSCEAPGTIAL